MLDVLMHIKICTAILLGTNVLQQDVLALYDPSKKVSQTLEGII